MTAAGWKPRPWLAAVLGFVLQWVGPLYAGAPRWAVVYFIATVALAVDTLLDVALGSNATLLLGILTLMSAVHAWRLAKRRSPAPTRPATSGAPLLIALVALQQVAIVGARAFLVEPFRVAASSMEPTLHQGETVTVLKWGYGHYTAFGFSLLRRPGRAVARGRLIAFDFPLHPSDTYLKRVIGIGGDVVEQRGATLLVNGQSLAHDPPVTLADGTRQQIEELDGTRYATWPGDGSRILAVPPQRFENASLCVRTVESIKCTVPPDQYFVVGDNRDNSADSRVWGFVPAANIVGPVTRPDVKTPRPRDVPP